MLNSHISPASFKQTYNVENAIYWSMPKRVAQRTLHHLKRKTRIIILIIVEKWITILIMLKLTHMNFIKNLIYKSITQDDMIVRFNV